MGLRKVEIIELDPTDEVFIEIEKWELMIKENKNKLEKDKVEEVQAYQKRIEKLLKEIDELHELIAKLTVKVEQ